MSMHTNDHALLFETSHTGNYQFDKLLIITRLIDHITEHIETLEQYLTGEENDFIDKAMYPFTRNLKTIANQALNRLQEVGNENREKILGSPHERR